MKVIFYEINTFQFAFASTTIDELLKEGYLKNALIIILGVANVVKAACNNLSGRLVLYNTI